MHTYFKVPETSELGGIFTAFIERTVKAAATARALVTEITNDETVEFYLPSDSVAGGVHSIAFNGLPDMKIWKFCHTSRAYRPRSNKLGNVFLSKFDSLDYVKEKEMNALIGFNWHVVSIAGGLCSVPRYGLNKAKDMFLIIIIPQPGWTASPDMIEITKTEYDQLEKESNF